ncbi:motility associated factor glycosyltransferase family protein [uncultured Clostridium sp.]|uniref:motility associated factor glycosyltransferase family protein n=1 Tax=uncultured Clostridium sp. TaxID=59620 RepID=UPI0025F486F0|nr:6-hydroxymethylpterin diphosphokinase MptE-like protein [uncultured Clostridium sp.]
MIELEESKVGLPTIKFDGRYIHSKYNPIKESEQFVNGNAGILNDKVIVLYGLGLGYHVDVFHKRMNEKSMLYVFEYNNEMVEICKKINPDVFKYDNVKIFSGKNKNFYNALSSVLGQVRNVIIYKSSLETIKRNNELLYNLINDLNIMKQYVEMDTEIIKQSDENYKANMEKGYRNISEYIEHLKKSKKPFVITAAGPSLDKDLCILKEYRDRYNIISVGSAFRTLIKNEIIPNAVVIIDTKPIVQKQFENLDCNGVPLCFSATSLRWAVEAYKGPKYIFNASNDDEIKTRGTVAVASMNIAIKSSAEEIILLGQDLAFINEKSDTKTFEEIYGFKDNYTENTKMKKVKGVNGTLLDTTQGYITFKNKIESLIRENPKIKFINCSRGAFIEGADHRKFSDLNL